MKSVAILGATGPTGWHLTRELLARGHAVRVVSRSVEHLSASFADSGAAALAANLLDRADTARALAGCDTAFVCVGLPTDRIDEHEVIARNVAAAAAPGGVRLVHVSSFWAYLPLRGRPISPDHPREGGGHPIQARRRAEDVLLRAGAAVVNLPDFYGPRVHASTLQNALREAVQGRTVRWLGGRDVPREYVYVPDAMKAVAELSERDEAYGRHWVVPGAGPITLNEILALCEAGLERRPRAQTAGPLLLRLAALFSAELRALLPLLPEYVKPISYDGDALRRLIGDVPVTPYAEGISATLDWLRAEGG
jgi:nucleoside-diphosphate-sugar epimerase